MTAISQQNVIYTRISKVNINFTYRISWLSSTQGVPIKTQLKPGINRYQFQFHSHMYNNVNIVKINVNTFTSASLIKL